MSLKDGRWSTAAVVAIALALNPFSAGAAAVPAEFSISWNRAPSPTNKVVVWVSGVNAATLRELTDASWDTGQWEKLLSVYAEQGDFVADLSLPAMLGAYRIGSNAICFEPRFLLEAGVPYRAVFRPEHLPVRNRVSEALVSSSFRIPKHVPKPTTMVREVYPTGDVLPENLLKFYIHFSAPMSRGHIYDHIRLHKASGGEVELPFLQIDEELWDPDMTRLTLFIDPGRIKREVLPLEEIGPALEEGKRYTLLIDSDWRDAAGAPLRESFRRTFEVGPPDREPPDPMKWKLRVPSAATRDSLQVGFSEPMDHALAMRMIRVIDRNGVEFPGTVALSEAERQWSFIPSKAWRAGQFDLAVLTTIEDLAGNNVGKPFEVDLFESVEPRMTNATVNVSFEVR